MSARTPGNARTVFLSFIPSRPFYPDHPRFGKRYPNMRSLVFLFEPNAPTQAGMENIEISPVAEPGHPYR